MTFSRLLFTVMCSILLVKSVHGGPPGGGGPTVDLTSDSTTAAEVEEAYKIDDDVATIEYNNLIAANACPQSKPDCSSGPTKNVHSTPGNFYWPPILLSQCDGLPCSYSRDCVPLGTRPVKRWAIVYTCSQNYCTFSGTQFLTGLREDVGCKCQCPFIRNCQAGYEWDNTRCRCKVCTGFFCPRGYVVSENECKCINPSKGAP